MKQSLLLAGIILALMPGGAIAEILGASSNGFNVKLTLSIQAPPDEVYRRLINVGDWWNSEHTYSHNSHNLSIEAKAMGCFCEKLPDGGSVRHMEVVYVVPGKRLCLTGALGPLQSLASTGNMAIALSPAGNGTKLELTYAVAGYVTAGMNTWAEPVNSVLTEQFTRLKNYIERGDPVNK